jgi:SAM-dependent methyltransferase
MFAGTHNSGENSRSSQDVYTFGTSDAAARRLDLLAELFAPRSQALLARWALPAADPADSRSADPADSHAVDLGCGPGHTTRLLHRVTGADRTTGVDRSASFLALARATPVPGIDYVEADLTLGPMPVAVADVVHARFVLTHLAAPVRAVRGWAELLRPAGSGGRSGGGPGGRLILQEVARLISRDAALGRYYELVAQLQEHHGQSLDVGARLAEIGADAGLRVEHSAVHSWNPPPTAMAALHVLNLRSWRDGRYAASSFDPDELDGLDAALVEIAHGRSCEPIEQDLAEVVLAG